MALFDFDKNFFEARNLLALSFLTLLVFLFPALIVAHYGWHKMWQETLILLVSYVLVYAYFYLVCQYVLVKDLWTGIRRWVTGFLLIFAPAAPVILLFSHLGAFIVDIVAPSTPIDFNQRIVLNCIFYFVAATNAVMLAMILWYIRAAQEQNKKMYLMQIVDKEHQIEQLRQQLSPHFLFNSLSTLQGLILTHPQQAIDFIHDLSDLYRYMLKQVEIVLLEDELTFSRAYLHLMQLRYGEALNVHEDVPGEWMQYRLPAISIQALVENAIKHNAISPQTPLSIEIGTREHDGYRWVVVANNRTPKVTPVESNGTGLANLNNRYLLRNMPALLVQQSEQQYEVEIPLEK